MIEYPSNGHTGGLVALAPDLYAGTSVSEPDEAGKDTVAMQIEKAADELRAAAELRRTRRESEKLRRGALAYFRGRL